MDIILEMKLNYNKLIIFSTLDAFTILIYNFILQINFKIYIYIDTTYYIAQQYDSKELVTYNYNLCL